MNLHIILANTLEVLEAQRAGINVFIYTPPSASSLCAGTPCAEFLASDTKGSLSRTVESGSSCTSSERYLQTRNIADNRETQDEKAWG